MTPPHRPRWASAAARRGDFVNEIGQILTSHNVSIRRPLMLYVLHQSDCQRSSIFFFFGETIQLPRARKVEKQEPET
jgi:hypothetical protein